LVGAAFYISPRQRSGSFGGLKVAKATFVLPRVLEPATGPIRRLEVEAATLREAVDALLSELPQLRVHLFDESRQLRRHVLCFVDGQGSSLAENEVITDGTEITFLQAVSGGSA